MQPLYFDQTLSPLRGTETGHFGFASQAGHSELQATCEVWVRWRQPVFPTLAACQDEPYAVAITFMMLGVKGGCL